MAEASPLGGSARVLMVVSGQPIEVAIDGANAPRTAGNFVDLVEREVYDGLAFHRVVRDPVPFVVQGGDPQSKDPNVPIENLGTGGFIDPSTGQEREIPLEIKPAGAVEPVYSQTFSDAGITAAPALPHQRGVIAMARSQAPDTASSQFYFALQDLPNLDGSYAVFGQIDSGLAAIDTIQQGDRITVARVVDGTIPGRTSAVVSDTTLLDGAINRRNRADVALTGGFTNFTEAGEAIALTGQTPTSNGFRGLGGDDTITGSSGDDVVLGDAGNDILLGEAGRDYLRGMDDNDSLDGGAGDDFINGNRGNDTVNGGTGNDFVRGGQDNDLLLGGDGNDVLCGDLGTDTLTGGAGADAFLLRVDDAAGDVITDFSVADGDRIALVGSVATSDAVLTTVGGDVQIALASGPVLGLVRSSTVDAVRGVLVAMGSTDAALRA